MSRVLKAIITLLLPLQVSILAAQENWAVITGTITDELHKPIPNVTITVSGINNFIETSNDSGKYKLVVASNNELKLTFSHPGYKTYSRNSPKLFFTESYYLDITLFPSKVNYNELYHYDSENVVASALPGKWKNSTLRQTISFTRDSTVLKLIPDKYNEHLSQHRIYLAGYMKEWSKTQNEYIYILVNLHGNSHVVFFRERDDDPYGDTESFNLFIAKGITTNKDILYIGGDFNNQDFKPWNRTD